MKFPIDLLTDELILVTGAARGNGAAIALGLARLGASVVVTDLVQAEAQLVATRIGESGGRAWSFALNVADRDSCAEVARRVAEVAGDISVLVNNAGICLRSPFEDSSAFWSAWQQMLDVNLLGILNVSFPLLPMLRRTQGRIINVASIASFIATAANPGYSVSKAGVKMLTQLMANELARDGIRVNAIAPSLVETAMVDGIRAVPGRMAELLGRVPMARVADPEEMVGPVAFLASPLSSYVTGMTMPVDGGFLAI
jgi:NAD(P)-dependent dehydrogenase (short-subunit alcohol dehydrogenase family)